MYKLPRLTLFHTVCLEIWWESRFVYMSVRKEVGKLQFGGHRKVQLIDVLNRDNHLSSTRSRLYVNDSPYHGRG